MQTPQSDRRSVPSWRRVSQYVWVGVPAAMLGGCFAVPVHESTVDSTLSATTATMTVGRTDRAEVRQVLGVPILASEYWGFDLFRISDWSGGLIVFVYVPIPVGGKVNGYVLVSYESSGKVAAYNTAIRESFGDVRINAGQIGFTFESSGDQSAVSANASRRDEYLDTQQGSDRCTVIGGCVQFYCPTKLVMDGDKPLSLPQTQRWLAPLSLTPGPHRLEIPPNPYNTFHAFTEFSCAAGELVYATIETHEMDVSADGRRRIHWKAQLAGSIGLSRDRPELFREQPMLIWADGTWLVPQEPGR